jgi:hypothetical protein
MAVGAAALLLGLTGAKVSVSGTEIDLTERGFWRRASCGITGALLVAFTIWSVQVKPFHVDGVSIAEIDQVSSGAGATRVCPAYFEVTAMMQAPRKPRNSSLYRKYLPDAD